MHSHECSACICATLVGELVCHGLVAQARTGRLSPAPGLVHHHPQHSPLQQVTARSCKLAVARPRRRPLPQQCSSSYPRIPTWVHAGASTALAGGTAACCGSGMRWARRRQGSWPSRPASSSCRSSGMQPCGCSRCSLCPALHPNPLLVWQLVSSSTLSLHAARFTLHKASPWLPCAGCRGGR